MMQRHRGLSWDHKTGGKRAKWIRRAVAMARGPAPGSSAPSRETGTQEPGRPCRFHAERSREPMTDFYATEKIMGGLVVVGVASLVAWSVSQNAQPGKLGLFLTGAMILGGIWVIVGLFELIVGHPWNGRLGGNPPPSSDPERIAH